MWDCSGPGWGQVNVGLMLSAQHYTNIPELGALGSSHLLIQPPISH